MLCATDKMAKNDSKIPVPEELINHCATDKINILSESRILSSLQGKVEYSKVTHRRINSSCLACRETLWRSQHLTRDLMNEQERDQWKTS